MEKEFISNFLNQNSIDFIRYYNSRKKQIDLFYKSNEIEIIARGVLIKNYFKTTNENSADYNGKILKGELFLTPKQFEDYVLKKIN